MVLFIIYIFIVILNFAFKRNKLITFFDFLYMWILMGWSYGNADYNTYTLRYLYPNLYNTLEWLYTCLQNLGKAIGLDYAGFLIVMSAIFLFIRFWVICKMSSRPNMVIGLYLLFPFIMDITQIRMFYAVSLVLLGSYFLLKGTKRGYTLFILFVILATLIHASCALYFILLPAYMVGDDKLKTYAKRVICLIIGIFILLGSGLLYKIISVAASVFGFGVKFRETVIAASMAYSFNNKIVYMIEIVLFFVLANELLKRLLKNGKSGVSKAGSKTMSASSVTKWSYKVNYALLVILPLAWFSGDIYRIQHGFFTMIYIALSNTEFAETGSRGRIKQSKLIIMILTAIMIGSFILLFLIGVKSLADNVFWPTFKNNRLL